MGIFHLSFFLLHTDYRANLISRKSYEKWSLSEKIDMHVKSLLIFFLYFFVIAYLKYIGELRNRKIFEKSYLPSLFTLLLLFMSIYFLIIIVFAVYGIFCLLYSYLDNHYSYFDLFAYCYRFMYFMSVTHRRIKI